MGMEITIAFARRNNLTHILQRQGGYKSLSLCSLRFSGKVCRGIVNAASPVGYFLNQAGILCDENNKT
jgi:hypothetical protein